MTAATRAELFETLADVARRYPDWRLGQLVANVAEWADQGVWDAEDEQLLKAAKGHLKHLGNAPVDVRPQESAVS